MNIDWVIPCRYAEVHDSLGFISGAGIDTFWLEELPKEVVVTIAVRLLATSDELSSHQPHTARSIIRDPDGDILSDVGGEFVADGTNARTEWLNGLMLLTIIRFEADVDGTYMFEHVVDASHKEIPLHIVHGQPPA